MVSGFEWGSDDTENSEWVVSMFSCGGHEGLLREREATEVRGDGLDIAEVPTTPRPYRTRRLARQGQIATCCDGLPTRRLVAISEGGASAGWVDRDSGLLARVSGMGMCGVILSAGRGTRLAPFSDTRPKASFPVGSRSLLARAVDVVRPLVDEIALNVSGHADWFAAHVPPGVQTFEEGSEPLGTAGGLYNMREWIDGRDVVVLNADSVLFGDVTDFIGGRDRAPTRLLVTLDRASPDFDGLWRFVGLSTMDQATLARIGPDTEDLYRDLWKQQLADGEVDLVPFTGLAIDGGTPANLLAANLVECGGRTVVERGATVDGTAEQCLVLAGGEVPAGTHLQRCIVDGNARFDLLSNSIVPTQRS